MQEVKVLVLNFDPSCGVASALVGMLESSTIADFKIERVILEFEDCQDCHKRLSQHIDKAKPNLCVLVASDSLIPETIVATLQYVKDTAPEMPILIVLEDNVSDQPFKFLNSGAADFVIAPIKEIDLFPRLWRLLNQSSQTFKDSKALKEKAGLSLLIGESPKFVVEIKKIALLAKTGHNVLISGETGTGKELCARALHFLSSRSHKPLVPVNCGAIPCDLMENELFGHERGAFTGAQATQHGLIHEANGGTLFLDEIEGLSPYAQIKFLRFLQEKEYRPLGSTKTCKAEIGVIGAINMNPEEAVKAGILRQDLYYRLNVIPLKLPPLRERREDILLLARHFLTQLSDTFGKPVSYLAPDAIQKLIYYDWPGNVRELENIIKRAFVLSEGPVISGRDIMLSQDGPGENPESFQDVKRKVIAEFEKTYIKELLYAHHGNISQAALAAKKNRRAFWQLINKHHIDPEGFRPVAA